MVLLVAIGLVAGLLAGVSPCILPVLPVILVAGGRGAGGMGARDGRHVARGGPRGAAAQARTVGHPGTAEAGAPAGLLAGLARPVSVVLGLVCSFSLVVLAGSELLSLLHLPQDSLRDAGIVALVVVGVAYLVPQLGNLLERPFRRLGIRQPSSGTGGFLLGLALGVLFVPCAGPVLAAIIVVGTTHKVGLSAVILTAAFAAGTSIPLLCFAVAGARLTSRLARVRRGTPLLRGAGGVVLVASAVAISCNLLGGLRRDVPGYTTALQRSPGVRKALDSLRGVTPTPLSSCPQGAPTLVDCGLAPDFRGITAWLNTPGGKPLSISGLRGKVVLVDFWTYSCINCQRTLPHVEAWYARYARDGFVVVGVHTPEFAFDHVVSNVRAEAAALGVRYPVAVDDDDATWNAYDNEYWPAEYLIDAEGYVRHVDFGEGGYATTESLIRQLLSAAHRGAALPPPTSVPDLTPTGELSPETYLGYERQRYDANASGLVDGAQVRYELPPDLELGTFALQGSWDDHAEEATAGTGAGLELAFVANDVYLVIGGEGTVTVHLAGSRRTETIRVAGVPRLFTLFHAAKLTTGTLVLAASPGIEAYDFTFG
ncbi:MAG TPA: cytochrome c biogenesis protein DipZ [Acidimicrobiales bacterium]|nr:cytochrome c biogenesis protein DipZ [Acidimicrobiales bacterium]